MDNIEIIKMIKSQLLTHFDDLIKEVILFGSRVDDKAREFSDYDVLIVINNQVDWKTRNDIIDVLAEINVDYDIIIDAHIISEEELNTIKGKQPFIENAIQSGITV